MGTLFRILLLIAGWHHRKYITDLFTTASLKAQIAFASNKVQIHEAFRKLTCHTLDMIDQLRKAMLFTLIGVVLGAFVGTIGFKEDNETLKGLAILLLMGPFAYSLVRIFLIGAQLELAKAGIATIFAMLIHGEEVAAFVAAKALGFPVPKIVSPIIRGFVETAQSLVSKYWAIICGIATFLVVAVVVGLIGNMAVLITVFMACIGLVTYSLWTGAESLFRKIASPVLIISIALLVVRINWQPAMEYCFPLSMKKAAVGRVLVGQVATDSHDKHYLGEIVYKDVVAIRTIGLMPSPSKCKQEQKNALMKRATANVKEEVTTVIVAPCPEDGTPEETNKPETQEQKDAKAKAEASKAERRAAADRVIAGKEQKEAKAVKADPTKKIDEKPAVKGDKEILDGIYTDAKEIWNIENGRIAKKKENCQDHLVALHKRVDTYVEGKKYELIPIPECKQPAPVVDASGQPVPPKPKAQAAAKPGSVEDLLASMKKRQKEVNELLKPTL